MVCVVTKNATQRLTRRSPFIRDPNNYQQYGTTVEFPFSLHSLHPLPSPPSTHPTQHRPLNVGLQPFLSLPDSLPPPPHAHARAHTHTHLSCPVLSRRLAACKGTRLPQGGGAKLLDSWNDQDCAVPQLWTLSPPQLRNHLWQVPHCTAPRCSHTGFDRSATHLCLFMSDSRLKDLPQTPHSTAPDWGADSCRWFCGQRKSPIQGGRWHTILPWKTLPHRTTQTQRYQLLSDPCRSDPSIVCVALQVGGS